MNAIIANRLITFAGGPKGFAKAIGLDYYVRGQPQRIHNWRHRGIPSTIVVEHYKQLHRLRRQAGM